LLDDYYNCKISDFGLSRVRDELGNMTSNVGFLVFMAPEVYRGENYSFAADVYSFGILLYELLTGQEANLKLDPLKYAYEVCNNSHRPEIPNLQIITPYQPLLQRSWSQNPEERPTFSEILKLLNDINSPKPNQIKQLNKDTNEYIT